MALKSDAELLEFWTGIGKDGWFRSGADHDERIRTEFHDTWLAAMAGSLGLWLTEPKGALAYVILTDQMPRNMFRGSGRAFASDHLARASAKAAIARDWDLRVEEDLRHFFYMPLEHSENAADQDRAVRLFACRMPEAREYLLHAKAHRDVIRRFGRFPFRNAALGRTDTADERAWLDAGGYRKVVEAMEAAA